MTKVEENLRDFVEMLVQMFPQEGEKNSLKEMFLKSLRVECDTPAHFYSKTYKEHSDMLFQALAQWERTQGKDIRNLMQAFEGEEGKQHKRDVVAVTERMVEMIKMDIEIEKLKEEELKEKEEERKWGMDPLKEKLKLDRNQFLDQANQLLNFSEKVEEGFVEKKRWKRMVEKLFKISLGTGAIFLAMQDVEAQKRFVDVFSGRNAAAVRSGEKLGEPLKQELKKFRSFLGKQGYFDSKREMVDKRWKFSTGRVQMSKFGSRHR